jgi:putative restriction endonuclease
VVTLAPAERTPITTLRIIRNTAVTTRVKNLHNYQCQVCGVRLETPAGPYAEGAHIRPLGSPHNGPDVETNCLCLCPNHHALFDLGAISIAGDGSLIGLSGSLRTLPHHAIDGRFLAYHREHWRVSR